MNPRMMVCFLAVLLMTCAPLALAHNCNVNTFPNWDGTITYGWSMTAQVIVPPPSCNMLVEYQFEVAGRDTAGSIQFSIFEWSPSGGPIGPALYTTTLPWDTTTSVIVVSNINLRLNRLTHYGAVIDLLGYTNQSVYFQYNEDGYNRGIGFWSQGVWYSYPGTNHRFRAKWAKP